MRRVQNFNRAVCRQIEPPDQRNHSLKGASLTLGRLSSTRVAAAEAIHCDALGPVAAPVENVVDEQLPLLIDRASEGVVAVVVDEELHVRPARLEHRHSFLKRGTSLALATGAIAKIDESAQRLGVAFRKRRFD